MLMLVNVAMSAILGVAVGARSLLPMTSLTQFFSSLWVICLIVLQAANMGAITNAITARKYGYVGLAVAIFLGADLIFFVAYASDPSALPSGSEGFAFVYGMHRSVWLLAALNLVWLVANISAAIFDRLMASP